MKQPCKYIYEYINVFEKLFQIYYIDVINIDLYVNIFL